MPVSDAKQRLRELVDSGELLKTNVHGWREVAYLHPKAELPLRIEAMTLLSPFDPLIWCRPRVERLFGFEYRVEIFVPPGEAPIRVLRAAVSARGEPRGAR